jgi:ribosomal protein S25
LEEELNFRAPSLQPQDKKEKKKGGKKQRKEERKHIPQILLSEADRT